MIDGCKRQINYARISVTDLCNLRCRYCMPEGVEKKSHKDILSIEELCLVSDALAELGVEKQRITGGEPLVRRGVMGLISHIGGNPAVKTLCITTNGQTLASAAEELYRSGVRRLNISLDTLNADKYEALTGGGNLGKVLDGIDAAASAGFANVKLNAVLLKGVNDGEIHSLAAFASEHGMSLRLIELMPFACQLKYSKSYFIGANEVIKALDLRFDEKNTTEKKVEMYYFSDGVEVGFIRPVTNRFCEECNRVRITADGHLLNCLHESREYDLRPYLGDGVALKRYIEECVKLKPAHHNLDAGELQKRIMEDIGG